MWSENHNGHILGNRNAFKHFKFSGLSAKVKTDFKAKYGDELVLKVNYGQTLNETHRSDIPPKCTTIKLSYNM